MNVFRILFQEKIYLKSRSFWAFFIDWIFDENKFAVSNSKTKYKFTKEIRKKLNLVENTNLFLNDRKIQTNYTNSIVVKYINPNYSSKNLFTHIRNSIAHGRTEIIDSNFIFTDMNGAKITAYIVMPISSLKEIVEYWCAINQITI